MAANEHRMRFGVFIAPYHRPDGDPGAALRRDLALVEAVEALGYDEAWFGEHHSGGWETIGCPELMIAAAAQRTSRIRLGTGVVSLPYHHPLMVADRLVQLDHLTQGRLMIGVGSGALARDARMIGIDPDERSLRFDEALAALMDLLRGAGPVTRRGRGFVLERAVLQLRPATRPHPPVYVASSFSGASLEQAARHRAGLLLLGIGKGAGERFRAAERDLAREGAGLDRSRILLVLNVHVAESRCLALDGIREAALAEQYEYWTDIVGMPAPDYPPHEHLERMIERGSLVVGSPGEVVDALESLLDEFGPLGGVLVAARDWAGPRGTRRSHELFMREVAPALRTVGHGRARADVDMLVPA